MARSDRTCVAVLGAGPAGLGAAQALTARNFDVVLLERESRVGGNAGSFELAGIPVDFGSHRFHPAARPEVLKLVSDLLGDDLLLRPRHGRIRLMGHWLHFPLQARDLLLNSPPRFAWGVASDLLNKFKPPSVSGNETFASVLRAGLGPTICDEFYFPYARKIWGIGPEDISATQAQKRVSSGSIGKMVRKLLPRWPGKHNTKTKGVFYYPRQGFGQICESLRVNAVNQGAKLHLGATVKQVHLGSDCHRVEYEMASKTYTLEAQHIWSTIPVTLLARLVKPGAPPFVIEAAQSLNFRGMLLIYLVLETGQFTPFDAHYLPGSELRITRLSEPKNYAGRKEPENLTVLCAELPCQPDEPLWAISDAELGDIVMQDLEQVGLPVKCGVRTVVVRRLPQAYPLYPVGFEGAFNTLDSWAEGLERVLTFGRQGLYAHDNTHHALHMALEACSCLGEDGTFDRGRWTRSREEFATHVVED